MNKGNTLANLGLCLSFWIVVVLVLLLSNGEFNDKAIATPISGNISEVVNNVEKIDVSPVYPLSVPAISSLYTEITGQIQKGESFDLAMKRLKIPDSVRYDIINGFSKTLDFKMLQPGDDFTIILEQDGSLARAIYKSGLLNEHYLERSDEGSFSSSRLAIPLECRLERISGEISTSLYAAFAVLGEDPKLIHAYADIFVSKIDFNTETRAGDKFELLAEKYYKDDTFVAYGRILVAEYQKEGVTFKGYHFASENTPSGYYDENGEALGTWFIRSPIPFGRVTSRFTMRRKHPIDGVVRPHLGIDLAAPKGTPVMATADGKVAYIGRKGGFGKTVILKHNGGYKTYYGHLNGYKKGLKTGSPVSQKDVVGYVGSTGISTGPHLDYRIQYNGVFRNPFAIKFKAKTVLKDEELALFLESSKQIAQLFNSESDGNILQVRNVTLTDKSAISFL